MGCINTKIKNDCIQQNTATSGGENAKKSILNDRRSTTGNTNRYFFCINNTAAIDVENPKSRVVTVFGKKSPSSSSRLFFKKGERTTHYHHHRLQNTTDDAPATIGSPTNHDRPRPDSLPELIIPPNTPSIVVDPAPVVPDPNPIPVSPATCSSAIGRRNVRIFTFGIRRTDGGGGSDPELSSTTTTAVITDQHRRKKRSSDNNNGGGGEKFGWRMRKSNSESEDWVLRIIRCFPFPSPRDSPRDSPFKTRKAGADENLSSLSAPAASGNSSLREANSKGKLLGSVTEEADKNKPDISNLSDEPSSEFATLGRMVRNTIQITLPPLVPWDWDKWLRKRLVSWIQCAGHEGTVVPATEKTVWKKCSTNSNEAQAYERLMQDAARQMAPKFYKQVQHQGECFLELEDLSRDFVNPSIMDVKMGVRTFLEREVKNESKRPDLYQKMITIDPDEPSASEREEQAITKLRYMTFREQLSSTASLGFRIDALKMSDGKLQKNFQRVKAHDQVMDVFRLYFGPNSAALRDSLLLRLYSMREEIEKSQFFQSHEVIGSSVLIMHDSRRINAWIIDFANAVPVEENDSIDHRADWKMGNREDGYLFGLDNLIKIIEELDLDDTIHL